MKKFLSLVMALVMTMSLVTISAGAFTDNSKVEYKDAVDVISTMGIVGGYADGSFKPEGTLTRGAAAKIICNMMLGVETASQLPSIASYKDVPAGSTYAPYIAYLKNEGVVGGYADNTYKPGNTLTGYAFLKMLLGALGYDATVEGLSGDGWQINVAKLAKDKGLYDGNDNFNGNAPATRQEACLYALNTMTAKTVKYDKKDVIQIGDVTIKNNSEAKDTGKWFYQADFDTLKVNANATDSQGRPAVKYTYGKTNKEIGKYGTDADHVIVASSDWSDNMTELKKALDNKDLTGFTGSAYYVNGDTATPGAAIKSGDVVEVFVDKDDANKITRIVVSQYTLVEVTKMDTKVTNKKDIEDDVEGYITVKGTGLANVTFKSTKFAGFDADYVKGTKLLVCLNGAKNEVFASEVAETVEGKVTSVKGSKVTIDGTTYTALTSPIPAIDDEGVFFLNKAGKIIDADLTASGAAEKYIYVYNGKSEAGKTGDDGAALDRVTTVYTVDSTGTQATYKVTDAATVKALFDETSAYAFRGDTVIPYKVESGKLVMTSSAADWTVKVGTGSELGKVNKDKAAVAKVGAYYANNDTQFVFAYEKDQAMKFSTAVGYKNVGIKDDVRYIFVAKDTDIKLVFVAKKDAGAAADETYSLGVVLDKKATVTKDDDDTLYTYDVVIDGVETTVTSKKALTLTEGAAYKFVMDGDKVDSVEALNSNTITKVASDDSYIIAGAMYEISDDVTVYTIHDNWKSEGGIAEHDDFTVSTGAVLEEGLTIYTFADKDDNLTIFFVKSDAADYV